MHAVHVDAGRHILADPDRTSKNQTRSNIKSDNLNPAGHQHLGLASSWVEVRVDVGLLLTEAPPHTSSKPRLLRHRGFLQPSRQSVLNY